MSSSAYQACLAGAAQHSGCTMLCRDREWERAREKDRDRERDRRSERDRADREHVERSRSER
jgi:Ni/Co efflux regulator RcnB